MAGSGWLLLCSTLALNCSACALLECPKACYCTGYPLVPCAPQLSLPLPLPPPACQVCYGTGNPATTFVMLDPAGNLVDFLHCPQFRCGVLRVGRLGPGSHWGHDGCGAEWVGLLMASHNGLPSDSLFLPR